MRESLSETDNERAQESADEAADCPANGIESKEPTDTRLREQGSIRTSPRSASILKNFAVSLEDSFSSFSMLEAP